MPNYSGSYKMGGENFETTIGEGEGKMSVMQESLFKNLEFMLLFHLFTIKI